MIKGGERVAPMLHVQFDGLRQDALPIHSDIRSFATISSTVAGASVSQATIRHADDTAD